MSRGALLRQFLKYLAFLQVDVSGHTYIQQKNCQQVLFRLYSFYCICFIYDEVMSVMIFKVTIIFIFFYKATIYLVITSSNESIDVYCMALHQHYLVLHYCIIVYLKFDVHIEIVGAI